MARIEVGESREAFTPSVPMLLPILESVDVSCVCFFSQGEGARRPQLAAHRVECISLPDLRSVTFITAATFSSLSLSPCPALSLLRLTGGRLLPAKRHKVFFCIYIGEYSPFFPLFNPKKTNPDDVI